MLLLLLVVVAFTLFCHLEHKVHGGLEFHRLPYLYVAYVALPIQKLPSTNLQ